MTRHPSDGFYPIAHDIAAIEDIPSVISIREDTQTGHLMVEHDGTVTWDELQRVKSAIWGEETRGVEYYPADFHVVNGASIRHIWRLGYHDWSPDLLGEDNGRDSLQARFARAWAEAQK
ncbi:MAG: DUF7694 domain-containing protein [Shimia sp.]